MSMQERLLQEKAKEQELKEKVRLAKEALKTAQEQLLLQQGAIKMLEELLQPVDISGPLLSGFQGEQVSAGNRRAKRSTKGEMQVRRRIVTKVLFEHGNSTANEILPIVNGLLSYDLKIHHLRNVLKKFTSDFEKGEEHGVWCLTESATLRHMSDSNDYFSEDDSSSS